MSANSSEAVAGRDFTRTWRYKAGFFLIIVGNLSIVAAALVLPFLGVGAVTIGTIVIGGEIVSLASIVFLGKEGFMAIKNRIVAFARSTYTGPVGRTRHLTGTVLLLTNVATTYLMMIYAWESFAIAVAEGPSAPVWGLNFEQQGDLVFGLFLIGELSFLVAIYVLGADWWERFRRIFVWEEPGH